MQARVLALIFVLVAGAAVSAGAATVVLAGGKVLEVESASINGGFVYLAYASGQMQAYAVEEVDLVASGLVPAATTGAAEAARPRTLSIADATSKTSGTATVKITDQDVGHVRGSGTVAEGEEEEGVSQDDAAAAAALLISNLSKQLVGAMVNLSGNVNNAGTKAVSSVSLEARALDRAGAVVGSGTTTISQSLEPKGQVGFTLSFPVDGEVADIRVRAVAAVAAFDFSPVAGPSADAAEPDQS